MLYDNIKRLCADRGLSLHALEKQAGIANGLIDDWEEGGDPKISTLAKIAQALDVSVGELIAEEVHDECPDCV